MMMMLFEKTWVCEEPKTTPGAAQANYFARTKEG